MSAYAYANLTNPQNTETGVADRFFWAPKSDFTTIAMPTPNDAAPVAGDQVIVSENHVFAATKGFLEFLCAPGTGKFEAKTVGEKGSTKFEQTFTQFLPGDYPELHEFAKNAKNTPGIALIQDGDCGTDLYHQLGSTCKYCWLTFEWSNGEETSGRKGYTVTGTFVYPSILTYTGDVTLHP